MERLSAEGHFFHRECFLCEECGCTLRLGTYSYISPSSDQDKGHFLCHLHYDQLLYKMQEEPAGMYSITYLSFVLPLAVGLVLKRMFIVF